MYERKGTFPEFADREVGTTVLQQLPFLRHHHRYGLPLYPFVFGRLKVEADVVICSTSGWAHGVQADGRKLLFVHNPARWLYQRGEYPAGPRRWQRAAVNGIRHRLRSWDREAARSADGVLAVSSVVQGRIRRAWDIDSTILHPPHGADPSGAQEPVAHLEPGFLLVVSRLLVYKHVDAVIGAMELRPHDRLVVVGHGPLVRQLRSMAPHNVKFLDRVSDDQLRWLYANARQLVAAASEDFGLTPLEAMAFGTPAVVLRSAGFLETMVEGETGLFFDLPEPSLIDEAIRRADSEQWSSVRLTAHADSFSEPVFREHIRGAVADLSRAESR
jgi:glycosyltransferase involved in cell wall biosynthesis